MKPTLNRLRERRDSGIPNEMQKLREAREAREGEAGESYTDDEREKIKALTAEKQKITQQIADLEAEQELENTGDRAETPAPGNGTVEVKDREWSLGDFAINFLQRRWEAMANRYQSVADQLSQGDPTTGGLAVPVTLMNQIHDKLDEAPNFLLGETDQMPVEGELIELKAVDATDKRAGAMKGGMLAYWVKEHGTTPKSEIKLRDMRLEPHQMVVYIELTDKLLRNAPAVQKIVTDGAISGITYKTNEALIRGNGSGQPLGVIGHPATIVQSTASTLASPFNGADVSNMWSRLAPGARANAIWLINVELEPSIDKLALENGNAAELMVLGAGGLKDPTPMRLKGRRVAAFDHCSLPGAPGDVILCDWKFYQSAIKPGNPIRPGISAHLKFDELKTALRWVFEVDGQPYFNDAIQKEHANNTIGTCVVLAQRS